MHKLSSTKKVCCQVKLLFKSTFHCHLSSTNFWSVTTSTFTLQFLNKFPNTNFFFRLVPEFEMKSINLLKLLQFMFNKYTIPQNWNFHLLSCFKRISPKTYHLKHFSITSLLIIGAKMNFHLLATTRNMTIKKYEIFKIKPPNLLYL